MRWMALLAMAAFIPVAPAVACSAREGYRVPTNFEIVRRADLIVLARVASGPPEVRDLGPDDWVVLETVRVLKGTAPAEPLRIAGALGWNGHAIPSLPTPLGPSHFSAGLGACIRMFYPQGGLLIAMFEQTPEGYRQIASPWARAVEDVEGPDGIWVRAVEDYVAAQHGVADADLRAVAEAHRAALAGQRGDLAAQAIAADLQYHLDETDPQGRVTRGGAQWSWLDMLDGAAATIVGHTPGAATGVRCEAGQPTMRIDAINIEGTPELALAIGDRRFEAEGEERIQMQEGTRAVSGRIAFTPELAEAMRTSPAPAGSFVGGTAQLLAPPGDVLQKLALRCAVLLAASPSPR